MYARQGRGLVAIEQPGAAAGIDQRRVGGLLQQLRVGRGMGEHQPLQHEFDIQQTALPLLEVETRRVGTIPLGPPPLVRGGDGGALLLRHQDRRAHAV